VTLCKGLCIGNVWMSMCRMHPCRGPVLDTNDTMLHGGSSSNRGVWIAGK
jgi:hypothetical protein